MTEQMIRVFSPCPLAPTVHHGFAIFKGQLLEDNLSFSVFSELQNKRECQIPRKRFKWESPEAPGNRTSQGLHYYCSLVVSNGKETAHLPYLF